MNCTCKSLAKGWFCFICLIHFLFAETIRVDNANDLRARTGELGPGDTLLVAPYIGDGLPAETVIDVDSLAGSTITDTPFSLGRRMDPDNRWAFNGVLDEVRVSRVVRSRGWI